MPASHYVEVSKLDKEFYPDDHVSKGVMLPHLAGRPLTMRRYPDGIGADGFFQKDASDYFPDWLRIVEVPQRGGDETARPGAPVATPLDWSELGKSTPNGHNLTTIQHRLSQKADPWSKIDAHAAAAATVRDRLERA